MIIKHITRTATYFDVNGESIVTLSPVPEVSVPCGDCVECCSGPIMPVLTADEFISGKYLKNMAFKKLSRELKKQYPLGDRIAVLAVSQKHGCYYLKDKKCTIYADRPSSCRAYDCRQDDRLFARRVCKKKFNSDGNLL